MFRKRPHDESDSSKELARAGGEPPAMRRTASLEVIAGPSKGETFPLTRMITVVGRDENCDIVLDDPSISREHGQIEQSVGEWVYANNSENGTWVNRKRVERVTLADGDTIEMGSQTRLRFVLTEEEATGLAPLVRRRPRRSREELEAEEEEAAAAPPPSIGETLRKRRKLFIGLGIYAVVIVAGIVGLKSLKSRGAGAQTVSGREWQKEDLERWVRNLDFKLAPDSTMVTKKLREAERLAQTYPYGEPRDLYNAVKCFREALEYGNRSSHPYNYQKIFDEAKKRLVNDLWDNYRNALMAEHKRQPDKARQYYTKIQRMIPEDVDFYKHVQIRMNRL